MNAIFPIAGPSIYIRAVFDHPDFPSVDQETLVKTNVAPAIGGLKAVVTEGSTRGMLDI
jgi:hypothetical protein